MGLFQPQGRKAETLLLAWLSASLKALVGGSLPVPLLPKTDLGLSAG